MKLVVLDGHVLNPGDLSWEAVHRLAEAVIHPRTSASDIVAHSADADFLFTNKTPLRAETLAQLPRLKYIGVLATGYDVVDVKAARERGIPVTNIPIYGTASVAQLAFALLLELIHRPQQHSDAVSRGDWARNADWCFWRSPLFELSGKTMGIIGFGRIGRETARIANAFGMRVLASDAVQADPPDWEGFRWGTVEEVLEQSDVISLHCPLTADTRGLINADRLRRMKRTALLLNTSRGPLVVPEDLAQALKEGVIAGAGLDVLPVEPPPAEHVLYNVPNCLITPHMAWATREARARLLDTAIENLAAFLAGAPRNVVN